MQRIYLHESNFRVLVEANSGSLDRIPIHQTQATGSQRQQTYPDPTYGRERYVLYLLIRFLSVVEEQMLR